MDNWKEKFYKNYTSQHLDFVLGNQSIEDIKRQFFAWKAYYGKFLPNDKGALILDVGCGNGGFVFWLKESGYENVFGVDISQEQITEAKRMGIKEVEVGDFRKYLKGQVDLYDCIFARDVIEHFEKSEILEIIETLYKALKPGGRLVIQTPNAESPFGSRYRYYDFTHGVGFTPSSLNQVLKAAGFKEAFFYPTGPVVRGVASFIRKILWLTINFWIRIYLLIEIGSRKGIFTQNMIAVGKK